MSADSGQNITRDKRTFESEKVNINSASPLVRPLISTMGPLNTVGPLTKLS